MRVCKKWISESLGEVRMNGEGLGFKGLEELRIWGFRGLGV